MYVYLRFMESYVFASYASSAADSSDLANRPSTILSSSSSLNVAGVAKAKCSVELLGLLFGQPAAGRFKPIKVFVRSRAAYVGTDRPSTQPFVSVTRGRKRRTDGVHCDRASQRREE